MEKTIQVKGTLPLVAQYFNAEEKRIYAIFNLDKKEEPKKNKEVKNVKKEK